MESEKLTPWNLRCLLIIMIICGSLVNGAFTVMQDTWISVLLMAVIYLPAILVYSRICTLFPEEDLFSIMETLFGRLGSVFIILPMACYALIATALQLRNFTEFTVVIALKNTPPIAIMIVLMLTVLYIAKQGFSVLGRWSSIICTVISINIVITILFSLNIMDPAHILPVMNHTPGAILSNSFALGSIAVGETVMMMIILSNRKKDRSAYRIYLPGVILGVGLFALIILRNIFILGADLENSAKFSTYMAVRIIEVGKFFERIESSISFVYILLGITKMALFLSGAAMGIARLLRADDYKKLLIPTGLLVLAIGALVFNNAFEMFDLVWVYQYAAIPFQLLIPVVIWIGAEIKAPKRHPAG